MCQFSPPHAAASMAFCSSCATHKLRLWMQRRIFFGSDGKDKYRVEPRNSKGTKIASLMEVKSVEQLGINIDIKVSTYFNIYGHNYTICNTGITIFMSRMH